jgi:uncharacterized membrane protein
VAEFFGLVVALVFLAFVFLPLLTFLRLGRIAREVDELSQRVAELEARAQTSASDVRTSVPQGGNTSPTVSWSTPIPGVTDRAPTDDTATSDARAASMPSTPAAPGATSAPGAANAASAADALSQTSDQSAAAAANASGAQNAPGAVNAATGPWTPGAPDGSSAVSTSSDDLEDRIGGRGLLYTGVLVLLLGVSFFLKYAFDNAWVNETARTVIGAVAGIGLVGGGLRLAASGVTTFGHALVGTGLAILYLVVYAALNFYGLLDRGVAFVLMALITVAAAAIADRQRAQALAFIAVGGGFLTPALVGGDENAQLTLFGYDALLVIGTLLLALRHQWPALNALSYIATLLTVAAWTVRFYTDAQWLRTLLFLTLFSVAFLIILRETRRIRNVTARAVASLLATAPVFYHLAAIVLTAAHPPAIHVYLIAFTVSGLWLTVDPHRPWLRLIVLLGALVPMFGTMTLPDGRSWLWANVITIVAVTLLHVMALVDREVRQDEALEGPDLLTLHVTGLGLFALLYEQLVPRFPSFRGALAVLIAVGAVALGRALRPRDEIAALNAAALAFTLLAIGFAVQFDGPPVVTGWAAEGLAIAWFGVRSRLRAFQIGGVALWILATLQLFDSFADTPAAFTLLLNARTVATLFVLATGYLIVWRLARAGTQEVGRLRAALHVIASTLTLAWITAEIQSYWDVRDDDAQAHLYEQMLLSLAWGLYGAAVIALGMIRRYAPLRYIGIVVIAVTSLKVFFYDLWELGGIYRVIGFLSFGVLLVLVSYLYQNRRRATGATAADDSQPSPAAAQPSRDTQPYAAHDEAAHDDHRPQL